MESCVLCYLLVLRRVERRPVSAGSLLPAPRFPALPPDARPPTDASSSSSSSGSDAGPASSAALSLFFRRAALPPLDLDDAAPLPLPPAALPRAGSSCQGSLHSGHWFPTLLKYFRRHSMQYRFPHPSFWQSIPMKVVALQRLHSSNFSGNVSLIYLKSLHTNIGKTSFSREPRGDRCFQKRLHNAK
jgi:hypothetical protein